MGEQNLHEYWRETFDRFKDGGILLERIESTLKDILQAVDQLHEGGFSLKHFAYKTLMSVCNHNFGRSFEPRTIEPKYSSIKTRSCYMQMVQISEKS